MIKAAAIDDWIIEGLNPHLKPFRHLFSPFNQNESLKTLPKFLNMKMLVPHLTTSCPLTAKIASLTFSIQSLAPFSPPFNAFLFNKCVLSHTHLI